MGKAAERRKASRQRHMASLVAANPERFQAEWSKRMDSLLHEVRRRAGVLVDECGEHMPPAFDVVREAERLLRECGVKEADLYDHCSINVLTNECCKALASQIDRRLYHLNVKLQKK